MLTDRLVDIGDILKHHLALSHITHGGIELPHSDNHGHGHRQGNGDNDQGKRCSQGHLFIQKSSILSHSGSAPRSQALEAKAKDSYGIPAA